MPAERVCVGVVTGAHGVRGLLRVKSFTEAPEDVAAYGPVSDESGERRFELTVVGRAKGVLTVRCAGVGDRDQAETLKGCKLYVARDALPVIEETETYYHADLIGLAVETLEGEALGTVAAVQDFGAGDVLEIRPANGGESFYIPFTRAAVPEVDLAGGRLVVETPSESESPSD